MKVCFGARPSIWYGIDDVCKKIDAIGAICCWVIERFFVFGLFDCITIGDMKKWAAAKISLRNDFFVFMQIVIDVRFRFDWWNDSTKIKYGHTKFVFISSIELMGDIFLWFYRCCCVFGKFWALNSWKKQFCRLLKWNEIIFTWTVLWLKWHHHHHRYWMNAENANENFAMQFLYQLCILK